MFDNVYITDLGFARIKSEPVKKHYILLYESITKNYTN